MENMNDLNDLLKHEIMDLISAEDQIISNMPDMIEKSMDPELKKALKEHLRVTEQQRKRLDQVQKLLGEEPEGKDSGLFSRLFKSRHTCKGMEGIISEGTKIMNEDMDPEVMDAAILASSQKIEHYEICGYGTARSYAIQLGHSQVAKLLSQTLDEEYAADFLLTELAERRINLEAEFETTGSSRTASSSGRSEGRATTKARAEEYEMEMASSGRKTNSTSGKSGASGSPKGNSSRSNGSSARGSGNSNSRKASSTRSESKSASTRGNSGSNGRGTNSGRSSGRSK
jgi:ferritin-like metal-binding protein YciE